MTTISDILNDFEVQLLEILDVSTRNDDEDLIMELKEDTLDRVREILERTV